MNKIVEFIQSGGRVIEGEFLEEVRVMYKSFTGHEMVQCSKITLVPEETMATPGFRWVYE